MGSRENVGDEGSGRKMIRNKEVENMSKEMKEGRKWREEGDKKNGKWRRCGRKWRRWREEGNKKQGSGGKER